MPDLFIGMPVFNGERFLAEALNTLKAQTYTDWQLLISDNCSTDRTAEICSQFAKSDSRISYLKQDKNIGASNNFKFLMEQADKEFFMWASSDDEWEPDFINLCIGRLKENGAAAAAFSQFVNIDSFGRTVRFYDNFMRFSATQNKIVDAISYLIEPEGMGKANLFYSVYRLAICREAWARSPMAYGRNAWGSDCIFNLAVIILGGYTIDNKVLFKKRLTNSGDNILSMPLIVEVTNVDESIFPQEVSREYKECTLKIFNETDLKMLAERIMNLRIQVADSISLRDELTKKNASMSEKIDQFEAQVKLLKSLNLQLENKIDRIKRLLPVKIYLVLKKLFN